MAIDLDNVRKEIADGLKLDGKPGSTVAGDIEQLRQYCERHNHLEAPFKEWRAAYAVLKDKNIDGLSDAQIKTLISFTDTGNLKGRGGITSSASQCLGNFRRQYGLLLQGVLCERAVQKLAKDLTGFWQKHVCDLVAFKKTTYYANFSGFVDDINRYAVEPSFHYSIADDGMATGSNFTANPEKLYLSFCGRDAQAGAIESCGENLKKLANRAKELSRMGEARTLESIALQFSKNVKPGVDECKAAFQVLEALTNERVPSRGRVWL